MIRWGANMKAGVLGAVAVVCLGLGILAVIGVVMLLAIWRVRSAMARAQSFAIAATPSGPTPEHYGIALVAIITGGDDYGTWPAEAPRKMLGGTWGITDTASATDTIQGFLTSNEQGDALIFDRVRAIHLARAAAGAGYVDQGTSWAWVRQASKDVQRAASSWSDVGRAYCRAKNAWLEERGWNTADGTEEKVASLERGMWTGVPFGMGL